MLIMLVPLIMTSPAVPAAMLLLLAAAPAPAVGPGFEGQMLFHQHIVIRIPRMPAPEPMTPPEPPLPPVEFHEESGPQCVASDDLIAATIPTNDRVDVMMRGGERLRIRLDKKCRTLDYYTGFYVTAGHDGRVCAKRDSIRTRSGDECGIAKFRRLVPGD
ncbi:hypothetical protein [Hephaestia mangrovi]|uniref:hypothetical protein n=1 Tax=Hephaestia mangrovi TaxID=2873268 RepID=UPI001CA6FAE2|nr:hypothetical protein [Hephaestia mangrovi]MBY8829527.1 hypothetical protein [Hephaestia mangrovi]